MNYYKSTYLQDWASTASAHFFVDDKECIICVPLDEKAWHVLYDTPTDNYYFGDDANDAAFGGELCYFEDDRERSLKALDNFARVFATLVDSWGLIIGINVQVIRIFKLISVTQVTHYRHVVMLEMISR